MMQKILIVGPAWVGDMVMAQVLFKLIRQQNPTAQLDVVAPAATYPLLARMPEISATIRLDLAHGELGLIKRYRLGRALRGAYDTAILLTNTLKSALVPFFANIPHRIGWRGEMRWGLLNDLRYLDTQRLPLMIQRFAALGLPRHATLPSQLPWPALKIDATSRELNRQKFNLDKSTKPILALCPGADYGPAKRWPANYFAAIANAKHAAGWEIWLLGGPNDRSVAAEIQAQANHCCVDLTGKTNLAEAIDLLSLASAVISNDSGLMHISAALARPLIVIYGSSSPHFTPPLAKQVKSLSLALACSPCYARTCPLQHLNCLKLLHPEQVLAALHGLVTIQGTTINLPPGNEALTKN